MATSVSPLDLQRVRHPGELHPAPRPREAIEDRVVALAIDLEEVGAVADGERAFAGEERSLERLWRHRVEDRRVRDRGFEEARALFEVGGVERALERRVWIFGGAAAEEFGEREVVLRGIGV